MGKMLQAIAIVIYRLIARTDVIELSTVMHGNRSPEEL